MPERTSLRCAIVTVTAVALTAVITAYFEQQRLRQRDVADTLQPIAALLADNQKIIESLKKDGYASSAGAIVSTYLARIRKDGIPNNSPMKERVDALVSNNTTIVALLSKYLPRAHSAEFRVAAGKFTDYASSLRVEWQSVFEIFMAGGNVPVTAPEIPAGFAQAVATEAS